ncbi:MAG: translation elongation factor-like protein [candidate division NC10 bacterium]|nr:translation elongation factor-like protein [candidate division NC10 bacterium]MDE2485416.1 translation elongation factor-like protein [candidate division NC10 bacterium]
MPEMKVGYVKEYFAKVGVAAIEITEGHLVVGDTIHIKGHTTDFTQRVDSIQLEHQTLQRAESGQLIGVKVRERVRPHDQVFKVTE